MKKLLVSYATYNHWANERLALIIADLDDATCFVTVPSSFSNLFETIEHIWQAELAWMQRIARVTLVEKPKFENKNTKVLLSALLEQGMLFKNLIENMTEDELHENVNYKNWQGNPFSTPTWQIVQHVINHSTFHRGQLVTMLRQLGVTTIPSTDYITYSRF